MHGAAAFAAELQCKTDCRREQKEERGSLIAWCRVGTQFTE